VATKAGGQSQGGLPLQVVIKSNGGSKPMTKNFATPDCSAKIVAANAESQGAGNVISHSRDEYFLNKCTDRSWFVVELCESIKALKVQLANFELYSSSPREVRVSLGHVWPARSQDWTEFGTFLYRDERTVQTFKSEAGVVGRYARLEVLSHHGTEHYCPISLFKVFGISEIDLITEDTEPGPEDEDEDEAGDDPGDSVIVSTIKDALKKVASVFRPKNSTLALQVNGSVLAGASLRHALLPPALARERGQVVTYLLATQDSTLRSYARSLGLHRALPLVCPGLGVPLHQEGPLPASLPWQWLQYVTKLHGEDFLLALCNMFSVDSCLSPLVRDQEAREVPANVTEAEKGAGNKTEEAAGDTLAACVVSPEPPHLNTYIDSEPSHLGAARILCRPRNKHN
jgi:hypothetical protein